MEKEFKLQIPTEPFADIADGSTEITVTYTGPRYMVISTKANGEFYAVDGILDDEVPSDFDINDYVHEDNKFYLFDADTDPFAASLITSFYTHDDIPTYTETLPTGEEIEHVYSPDGIIEEMYNNLGMKYNPADGFHDFEEIKPYANWADTSMTASNMADQLTNALNENTYTDEEAAAIQAHIDWCNNINVAYDGVAAWKIPWPNMPKF